MKLRPASLVRDYWHLLARADVTGPILDLACGDGNNGIFLATHHLPVICCDISVQSLERAEQTASALGVRIRTLRVDLEGQGVNLLGEARYAGILVFRYLHRPLMTSIKKAIKPGGLLFYETYTVDQRRFGRPRNPDYLLRPGELLGWFTGWDIIHHFEGILEEPLRAVSQLICKSPRPNGLDVFSSKGCSGD